MTVEEENRLRDYAAGKLAWKDMRADGMVYWEVLTNLGKLKLRPPMVGEHGPNAVALAEGRRLLDAALDAAAGA